MTFSIYNSREPEFNRKKVNSIILKIQRGLGTEEEKSKLKFDLFLLMKNIVIKNIANYKMLYRNSPITGEGLESFEMESECYLIIEKCLIKYKVKKTNCFYFYYNKSLSRSFYRMFDKNIRKKDKYVDYKQHTYCVVNNNTNNVYSTDLIVDLMNLDDYDKKVITSKMNNEKKEEFVKNNNSNLSKYQSSLNKIKEQLNILKDNGQI